MVLWGDGVHSWGLHSVQVQGVEIHYIIVYLKDNFEAQFYSSNILYQGGSNPVFCQFLSLFIWTKSARFGHKKVLDPPPYVMYKP